MAFPRLHLSRAHAAIGYAITAALLYALSTPMSKFLVTSIHPALLAALLYLGAGIGMTAVFVVKRTHHTIDPAQLLGRADLPYTIAMIVLDIAAPILLMFGISMTTSATVSLLNNFEIVATSLIALVVFKEIVSRRLWAAIIIVTIASALLSFDNSEHLSVDYGALLVLAASVCWGIENNCTTKLATKSAQQIVMVKGLFSGCGSVIVAWLSHAEMPDLLPAVTAMVVGFFAYGLSINFYVLAQKDLGAAKTSAYYAIAPFLGVMFSMLLLREQPELIFWIALLLMVVATYLMVKDSIGLQHLHEHEHTHTHEHSHSWGFHTHEHTHRHAHPHTHAGGSNENEHWHHHEFLDEVHSHDDHTHAQHR